jgi:hypothetical protein
MISVDLDLASPGIPNNTLGLYRINIADVPELANEGYNHSGDLTYYNSDEVTIEHFTNTIRVNGSYTGPSSQDKNGTPSYPFKTFNDAKNILWNRAIIKAKAGSYPESVTLTKQVKLVNEDGLVLIGQ